MKLAARALLYGLLSWGAPVFACEAPEARFCVDFFQGVDLAGPPLASSKTPYIEYDWQHRSPARHVPYDRFSARWRGRFQFNGGAYRFIAKADEGVRLKLDGTVVMAHWGGEAGQTHSLQLAPTAGSHLLEVEYFEETGDAHLRVVWAPVAKANPADEQPKADQPPRIVDTVAISEPVAVRNPNRPPLGVNLSGFAYFSSAVPFKDLIRQSGLVGVFKKGSKEACAEQPVSDAAGYPLYLPQGCVFRLTSVFHILNDQYWPKQTQPYKKGRYVLLHRGEGKIRLGWDAKQVQQTSPGRLEFEAPEPKDGISLEIIETAAANPITDVHIVHVDDETSFRQQPFNETWLSLLKPFTLLRFTDWAKVNKAVNVYSATALSHSANSIRLPDDAPADDGEFDGMLVVVNVNDKWPTVMIEHYDGRSKTLHLQAPIETATNGRQPKIYIRDFHNKTWAQRSLPNNIRQDNFKGIALETMIQLANTLNVDAWFSVPTAADDDFVERMAQMIKQRLKPHLKCYLEYSNETWNTAFPSYGYSDAKAKALALTGTAPQGDAWQAYRAVEVFKIFNRVFGEADLREQRAQSRLVRVLTSQTAWLSRSLRVMDWQMPNKAWPTLGQPAHKFADAWAITTYFQIGDSNLIEQADNQALMGMQIQAIDDLFGTPEQPGTVRQLLAAAKQRHLQLVGYEGGTHLLAPRDRVDLVDKLAGLNQSAVMRPVYGHLLQQWAQLYLEFGAEAVGIWNHYCDVGGYSKWGYWGLLQSSYQDPSTAPKYQAVRDFVYGR